MANDGSNYRIAGPRSKRNGSQITVTVRRDGAKLEDAAPDDQGTDLTGGWEGTNVYLRINRAGRHLEGWHCDYLTKVITPFAGDVAAQETFSLWESPGGQRSLGTLSVVGNNDIALVWNNSPGMPLRKLDHQAGFSDNALLGFESQQRQEIMDEQRRPLSTSDRRTVIAGFRARILGPFIDRYYALPSQTPLDAQQRALVVQEVDRHVGTLFNRLHQTDRRKARGWAVIVLSREQHAANGRTQTLLQWLQEMVEVTRVLGNDPVPNLQAQFHLSPGNELHHYRFILKQRLLDSTDLQELVKTSGKSLLSVKPGLGGGWYGGTLQIQKLSTPELKATVLWENTFPISIGQVGVGFGLSVGSDNDAIISTAYPWQPANFSGMVKIVDLSAGIGPWSWGLTGAFFKGDGTFPELIVDFSGQGTNYGGGAGLAEAVGMVGTAGTTKLPSITMPTETIYEAQVSARTAIHFQFGLAKLTEEGRQILRVLAAQELAVFRSGYAELVIESHADRVDDRAYNVLLTKARSWNTYQALKDILGKNLHYSTTHRQLGLGETGAEKAGDPDNTENPAWRRSDITVNGRLVMRLRGEGQNLSK